MNLFLIAPISAVSRRTRIAKMVVALTGLGYRVRFAGWERKRGEAAGADSTPNLTETIWLRGGGYSSSFARAMYPLWMAVVFVRSLFLPRRSLIVALGFESAFPAILASYVTKSRVIFDDADRFSMVVKLPAPLRRMVEKAERWASAKSAAHLIPGWSRYDWRAGNMHVLRNSPSTGDFAAAKALGAQRNGDSFVVYVNGWVGETRGAPPFLALMQRLETRDRPVCLRVIGRGEGAAFEQLIRRPDVEFSPQVPQAEALAAYIHADLVLTYYDPSVPINRLAESNKWGDCIYFGTPFVVNDEVATARDFVTRGGAFAVPYHDAEALADLIDDLAAHPHKLAEAGRKLAEFRADYLPYDEALLEILRRAGVPSPSLAGPQPRSGIADGAPRL